MSTIRLVSALTLFSITTAYAYDFDELIEGDFYLQGGVFFSSDNESQNIDIEGLIGNEYTASSSNTNALIGLGYFFDLAEIEDFILQFGINAFYFFETDYKGEIIQEHMFHNLDYSYDVTHIPIYFGFKGLYDFEEDYAVTLDVGIGPNFIRTSDYNEDPLNEMTIPDSNTFAGKTTTQFSAMAGLGFKVYEVIESIDMELGYRFFYLGEGELNKEIGIYESNLKTGSLYANSILLSVIF